MIDEEHPARKYLDDEDALRAMLIAEERGDYPVLGNFIQRVSSRLSNSETGGVRAAFLALVERTRHAFDSETIHGKWSLMKWDHPLNVKLVSIGLLALSPVEKEAFDKANANSATS